MAPHIDDLPDELLLLILGHLPTSSLVSAAPDVSLRWRRLSLDAQLWRRRPCRERWASDADAVRFLSRGPALAALSFQRRVGGAVLRCVARRCPSLAELGLHGAQRVGRRTLRALAAGCPRLRVLRVGADVLSCRRRARVVALLMPSLETLALSGHAEAEDGAPRLLELGGGCPALRTLELNVAAPARLSDLGPALLGRLRGLALPWEAVSRDVAHCAASLRELTLDYYDDVARPDAALAEDLRPLTALTRVDARFLGGDACLVGALLQPALRALTLSWCPALDDALLLRVCRRCPLLEDLDVCHCENLTAEGLSALRRLRGLRRLCLAGCGDLGGGAAEHLARCGGLRELNLDDVDLGSLEPGVPKLLELRKMRVLILRAWGARDLIPWEAVPGAFPDLRVLDLGEWMSLDTTLPESLKAAMPGVLVRWSIGWELREGQDAPPEEGEGGDPAAEVEPEEEPDLDLFIFRES